MRRSKLVSRNNKLCITKANTQQGLISNVMDRPLETRTGDMVRGMVADTVMVMPTTPHHVGAVLPIILHFPC